MNLPSKNRTMLEEEIANLQRFYTDSPPDNEACTCDWIIRPLLEKIGYDRTDIVPQAVTGAGGFPDYTILPNTEFTWYLEAKDWKRTLENGQDAIQALNYANSQGRRWVVLSNGRDWLLFDNTLVDVQANERLVVRSSLNAPDFADFMEALSKESVTSGQLEKFANQARLNAILDSELEDKESATIKAIGRQLRKNGLSFVRESDIVEYFDKRKSPSVIKAPKPIEMPQQMEVNDAGSDAIYTLAELKSHRDGIAYNVPKQVFFPDGTYANVNSWKDIASEVVFWIAENKNLPALPFRAGKNMKNYFLALEPKHPDGHKMNLAYAIQVSGQTVYIHTNQSSRGFINRLNSLCEATSTSPDDIRVQLSYPIE